jgi:ElaB/YqjD/DUF883 family membrane-anchored ribosome-binding protein
MMEVDMGDVTIETGEQQREGMDLTELSDRARELALRARDWIADNPFAALGIAVGSGFLLGRAMRIWALRP